jgi:hypothetical protein
MSDDRVDHLSDRGDESNPEGDAVLDIRTAETLLQDFARLFVERANATERMGDRFLGASQSRASFARSYVHNFTPCRWGR